MPIDPILGGALVYGASTLVNGFFSQRSAAYNQEQVEKNTALNYKYSQMAQRNAPVNEVYGLRAAGLSPTLANGAQGVATSAGSAGTASAPPDAASNAMLYAQLKNIQAQADKTAADAESVKIDNANKKQRDAAFGVALDADLEHLKSLVGSDSKSAELIDQFLALPKSEGTYNALERVLSYLPKTYGARADMIDNMLKERVNQARWQSSDPKNKSGIDWIDNPLLKSLANADAATVDKVVADISKVLAEKDNLEAVVELTRKQTELTKEDIERVKSMTSQIRNSDVKSMIDKGDYKGALLTLLTGLIMGLGNYK